ncbi:MAG: hypothetical protein Q4E52_09055 [Fibrobacter sp.]|nr:hypothetical protein [Fibrobacter sp.]
MKKSVLGAALVAAFGFAQAEPLPTATEIFEKMGLGINIGNTMGWIPYRPLSITACVQAS